jgi:murein DD-endopeptidase MepM/ murein hydrolase activator NlpD
MLVGDESVMNCRFWRFAGIAFIMLSLQACASQPSAQSPPPTPTLAPLPQPSVTPEPSATATQPPTLEPSATSTPKPSATPTPTPEPSATPTETPIPAATATSQPTAVIPDATASPEMTAYQYVFPVRSSGEISYGAAHHDYPATDIFCPIGSEYVAVIGGVIDFVSTEDLWSPSTDDPALRGGISVAFIGDDGVRYYGSHLSAVAEGIEPGVRVEMGQVLGLSGKSGNAASTPPHVHFGISRPTTPDDWRTRRGQVSPYPYLQAWRRGEHITPELP